MHTEKQQAAAAKRFAEKWQGKGYDRAVMETYGFPVKNEFTESLCVAELFKLYQELTK